MNMKTRLNFLYKFAFIFLCIILIVIGYKAGNFIGAKYISEFYSNGSRSLFSLYRPANEYFKIYGSLNSINAYERLTGYYSLLDNKIIDEEFLFDRYKREELSTAKLTIVWILSFSKNIKKVEDIYGAIYAGSNYAIKKEILRALFRMDRSAFNDFARKFKVDEKLLREIRENY